MPPTGLIVAIIIVVLLVIIFNKQIYYLVDAVKSTLVSLFTGKRPSKRSCGLPDDDELERMSNKNNIVMLPKGEASNTMIELGYTGGVPWSEVLAVTEVDPAIHASHMDFVKDVRRYSSGANFTSVTDDNTNIDFTNFRGLQRPTAIEHQIGESARQTPDIDETVLTRNKLVRWT